MSDEPKLLRVYIDESGDEGIDTGGSRWFILGAVLILEEELDQIEAIVPVIRQRMNKEPSFVLRWRKMDYETRLFVSQQVATVGLGFSCVVIDKEHDRIKTSGLRGKYMMYNYATRYLVERISWFARDLGRIARLTFEHRSNLDYDALWSISSICDCSRQEAAAFSRPQSTGRTMGSCRSTRARLSNWRTVAAAWYGMG